MLYEEMMRYHFVFSLVLFCFAFSSASAVSEVSEVSAEKADVLGNVSKKIEKVIQPYNKFGVFNGSILIAQGNEVMYQRGFGSADISKNIANAPDTPFRIGSLSKTFTALLIMQLLEEKLLSLAEPLHNILPEYNSLKGQKITIRHLLAHTSGLPGHFELPGWKEGRYQNDFRRRKWLQIFSQLELLSEPGHQYQYGNINYFLLGSVIEKITGMSYEENLQKRIFQPANMHNSGADESGKYSIIPTQGYRIGKTQGYQVQFPLNIQVFFAAANIYSTVVDLFNFEQALFSGQLIKKDTLDFWLEKEQSFAWQSNQLDLGNKKPLDWLSYNGQLQGFSSMLSIFGQTDIQAKKSQERVTIIMLSNSGLNYRHKQQLTLELSNVLLGLPVDNDTQTLPLSASFPLTKAAIEGTLAQQTSYILSNPGEFEVHEQDVNLLAQQLFWSGALHKAILIWELNSQFFPDSNDAYKKLEEACVDKRLVDESVTICQKYTVLSPNNEMPKGILIKNITVISPELNAPLENHDVYIIDDKIVSIGKALKANANQVLDGTGQFLTPGLIDAHTHLSGVPGMTFEQRKANPSIVEEASVQIPKSYLYHGFTTVIDLNSDTQSIANWNQQLVRPKAYFCGAAPILDGYPMNFMPKPLRYQIMPYFILEGESAPQGIDPSQHTPHSVVAKMQADGAICVKTHYESGFGGQSGLPTPSLDLIRRLKQAAKTAGLPLLLHANSQAAQKFGLTAGVDVFAHGMWTWDDRTKTAIHPDIKHILDSMIEQKIALQPTIQVLYGERDLFDPKYLEQKSLAKVLPQTLIDWYKTSEGQGFHNRLAEAHYFKDLLQTQSWENISKQGIKHAMKTFSYIARKGGKLSFGSDTPSDLTFANPPGLNARFEMRRWQQAGVTPKQFLAAATIENAKLFNLHNLIGSVQVSKRADLLILKDNPLKSIDAFDSIQIVISAGNVLPRISLAANFGN